MLPVTIFKQWTKILLSSTWSPKENIMLADSWDQVEHKDGLNLKIIHGPRGRVVKSMKIKFLKISLAKFFNLKTFSTCLYTFWVDMIADKNSAQYNYSVLRIGLFQFSEIYWVKFWKFLIGPRLNLDEPRTKSFISEDPYHGWTWPVIVWPSLKFCHLSVFGWSYQNGSLNLLVTSTFSHFNFWSLQLNM